MPQVMHKPRFLDIPLLQRLSLMIVLVRAASKEWAAEKRRQANLRANATLDPETLLDLGLGKTNLTGNKYAGTKALFPFIEYGQSASNTDD